MRRIVLPLSLVALGLTGCKKNKEAEAEAEATPKAAPQPLTPEVEISKQYPEATWGTLTVVQPGAFLDALVEQASPGYDWRAKVEGKAPGALAGFDLDAPIDLLAGYVPKTAKGERVALAFGVKSQDAMKKSLDALEQPWRMEGSALGFGAAELSCQVQEGATRAKCWIGEEAQVTDYLEALDGRKHDGAARMQVTLDGAYLRGPLKVDVDGSAAMAKVFGPQAFEKLKDTQLKADATALLTDVVDGTVAFIDDLERLEFTVGLQPQNAGVFGRMRLRLSGHESTFAKWLAPERLPSGPAPAELLALPGDVDSASYVRTNPESVVDPAAEAQLERLKSLGKGVARELGLPDAELDAVYATIHVNPAATWNATVTPRLPRADIEAFNFLAAGQQQNMVWLAPRGSYDALASADAVEAYLKHPEVEAAITRAMGDIFGGDMAEAKPKFTSGSVDGLGTRNRRWTMNWNLEQLGEIEGLPKEMNYVLVMAEDDAYIWTGFGTNERVLLDYMRRAMAKEGPTIGDDPRTAFLRDEDAFMANYTPIDPVYVGQFATELLRDLSGMTAELNEGEVNAFAEFEKEMPALVEKWKSLPPSAARARVTVDDAGVVYEGSLPAAALRMVGDSAHMMAGVFREQKG